MIELESVKFDQKTMKSGAFLVKLQTLSKRALPDPIPLPVVRAGFGEVDRVPRENEAYADQERNNL